MKNNYRRCISCRRVAHRNEFWRIVRSHQTGEVMLDQGMGRSAYLCPTEACLQKAHKKKRVERSLRISVPPDLYQTLWARLENSTLCSR